MTRSGFLAAFVLFVSLFSLPLAEAASAGHLSAGDPQVIDVLMIDRKLVQGPIVPRMLEADPSISIHGVPMPGHWSISHMGMSAEAINREMRIYMPRTFGQLVNQTDLILLKDAPCGSPEFEGIYFPAKWMSWFITAVQNDGMPFSMWGGDASWGGHGSGSYNSWGDTILDPILPFKSIGGYSPPSAGSLKPFFLNSSFPLARLPWKSAGSGPIELLNTVEPKPGARLVAEAVSGDTKYPWIAWWMSGKGKVVGEAEVFESAGTSDYMLKYWDWYQDFVTYLVYFAVDKPVPQDVYLVHRIRRQIDMHIDRVNLFVSLIGFIEKYGANTHILYEGLDSINNQEKVAERDYRQGRYDEAATILSQIQNSWEKLDAKAISLKKATLIWVYLIEWFAVTGAALISGSFLWLVMVRRRLFREMGTTRMTEKA